MKGTGLIVASVLGSLLLSGCATKYVWKEANIETFHEPSGNGFELFQDARKNDVLAVYNERRSSGTIRQRAYLVHANKRNTDHLKKPRFSDPSRARDLQPLPVFTPEQINTGAITNTVAPVCAVRLANARFELIAPGPEAGFYTLPVYRDKSATTKQVLITPFAVTLDLTLIGSYLFLECMSHGNVRFWK